MEACVPQRVGVGVGVGVGVDSEFGSLGAAVLPYLDGGQRNDGGDSGGSSFVIVPLPPAVPISSLLGAAACRSRHRAVAAAGGFRMLLSCPISSRSERDSGGDSDEDDDRWQRLKRGEVDVRSSLAFDVAHSIASSSSSIPCRGCCLRRRDDGDGDAARENVTKDGMEDRKEWCKCCRVAYLDCRGIGRDGGRRRWDGRGKKRKRRRHDRKRDVFPTPCRQEEVLPLLGPSASATNTVARGQAATVDAEDGALFRNEMRALEREAEEGRRRLFPSHPLRYDGYGCNEEDVGNAASHSFPGAEDEVLHWNNDALDQVHVRRIHSAADLIRYLAYAPSLPPSRQPWGGIIVDGLERCLSTSSISILGEGQERRREGVVGAADENDYEEESDDSSDDSEGDGNEEDADLDPEAPLTTAGVMRLAQIAALLADTADFFEERMEQHLQHRRGNEEDGDASSSLSGIKEEDAFTLLATIDPATLSSVPSRVREVLQNWLPDAATVVQREVFAESADTRGRNGRNGVAHEKVLSAWSIEFDTDNSGRRSASCGAGSHLYLSAGGDRSGEKSIASFNVAVCSLGENGDEDEGVHEAKIFWALS